MIETTPIGYQLADLLESLSAQCRDNRTVDQAIQLFTKEARSDDSPSQLVLEMLSMYDSLANDVTCSAVPDDLKQEYIAKIEEMKLGTVRALLGKNAQELHSRLGPKEKATVLRLFSDVVRTGGGKADYAVDRTAIVKDTQSLIEQAMESGMPEYARKTFVLQLNSLITAANHAAIYPADEIRQRIKGIVADFMVDFEAMDDEYKSLREKVISFARKHLGVGAFALGLIADGSAVAALLPPPKGGA